MPKDHHIPCPITNRFAPHFTSDYHTESRPLFLGSRVSSILLEMSPPTLIFGAGFLGVGVNFATPSELQQLLGFLRKKDIKRIDTARRYPSVNSGRSEQLLGEVNAAGQGFKGDTKIKIAGSDASGSVTASKIKGSGVESLEALRIGEVGFNQRSKQQIKDTMADKAGLGKRVATAIRRTPQTPIEETAQASDEVYRQGKFTKVTLISILQVTGIDNVPQAGSRKPHRRTNRENGRACAMRKGHVRPSGYQGQ